MTERPTQPMESTQAPDAVDSDAPCIGCGYILRGLAMNGVCPECAVAVRRSLQGDHLIYADPRWLRVLVFGQSAFAAGIVAIVVTPVVGVLVILGAAVWDRIDSLLVVVGIFPLLGVLAIFVGTMIGTTQDPRESEREAPTSARRVARISLLFAALLSVIGYGISYLRVLAPYEAGIMHVLVRIVLPALFAVAVMATLRWMNLLARRMRSKDLIRLTGSAGRYFGWLAGIVIVFLQVHHLTAGATPVWVKDMGLERIWDLATGVLSIAYVIAFFTLIFRMLRIAVIGVRMRTDLARVAKVAGEIPVKRGARSATSAGGGTSTHGE